MHDYTHGIERTSGRRCSLVYRGSTIVCAIDDSDHGVRAASVAAELAERLDRRLIGAHAVRPWPLTAAGIPYAIPPPDATATRRYESAAATHAREVLDDAGARDACLRTTVGHVSDVLLRVADEEDALMLVIGTTEASTLRSLLLGNEAEAVLRSAARPVLLVPAETDRVAPGPVLAAIDGPRDAAWIRLAELLAFAHGGRLLLAHILEDEAAADPALSEAESRVEAFDPALRALGPTEARIETRVGFGATGERLVGLAQSCGASLIVTGSHHHGRLHVALLGSTARTLIGDARVPTVVCPSRA